MFIRDALLPTKPTAVPYSTLMGNSVGYCSGLDVNIGELESTAIMAWLLLSDARRVAAAARLTLSACPAVLLVYINCRTVWSHRSLPSNLRAYILLRLSPRRWLKAC